MESNIDDPLGAEELAAAAAVSVRQMERLFSRHFGISPKRHYQKVRLQRANDLLVQTDLAIAQIAITTGFAAVSHFSKCFKVQFGFSPHVWRNKTLRQQTFVTHNGV